MQRRTFFSLATFPLLNTPFIEKTDKPFVVKANQTRFNEALGGGTKNDLKVSAKDTDGLLAIFEIHSKGKTGPALHDIRQLSKSLNEDNILTEGLAKAIAYELARVQKGGSFTTHFEQHYLAHTLDRSKEILVFRMFQELLQNAVKHAQASHIWVQLQGTKQEFSLNLKDDGQGFDYNEKIQIKSLEKGAGLHNLQHRAQLLGGQLSIETAPGQGCLSRLRIEL